MHASTGQFAGWGVRVFGQVWETLIDNGFWKFQNDGSNSYEITITTRDADVCDASTTYAETVGARSSSCCCVAAAFSAAAAA